MTDIATLTAEHDRLRAALESTKAWMEQLRDLHQRREDGLTAWPMPGMNARYREICAALADTSPAPAESEEKPAANRAEKVQP